MHKLDKANSYMEENKIPVEQRPSFHVTAPIGWINDPNGFSVYQNKYHLFYQYHPYSDVWGPMHWGHCITQDFLKWDNLPVAMAPDESYDANGCFSGSAIETEKGHVLVYTGVREEERDGKKQIYQNQCLAVGDGVIYKKQPNNPVIDGNMLPAGFSREDFRDPKIWYEDGTYYLVVCNKKGKDLGQVLLFESKDLASWRYVTVLAENNGNYGKMWECPDFFELDGKNVLIVSPQDMRARAHSFYNGNHSIYFTGNYEKAPCKFHYGDAVLLDYGLDFYAPQTLLANDGRRIMIAWMQSWDSNIKPVEQKWNGMMTIPRELRLVGDQLYQAPVREIENYRTNHMAYHHVEVSGTCSFDGIKGRVLDLSLEVLAGDFNRLSVHIAHNEAYTSRFTYDRVDGSIEFDRTYSGMIRDAVCQRKMKLTDRQKPLKLRLILDKFSAELFVNDGCQTFSTTFYTPLEADDIVFTCDGKAVVNLEKYDIQL